MRAACKFDTPWVTVEISASEADACIQAEISCARCGESTTMFFDADVDDEPSAEAVNDAYEGHRQCVGIDKRVMS